MVKARSTEDDWEVGGMRWEEGKWRSERERGRVGVEEDEQEGEKREEQGKWGRKSVRMRSGDKGGKGMGTREGRE